MRIMNISGIYPYNFNQQRRDNMRDAFDAQLDKYLDKTSKEPFTACSCCGRNIFDGNRYAFKYDGQWLCDDCVKMEPCDRIEPDEWR